MKDSMIYEAILLSFNGDEVKDPSKDGFESEDEAWLYVESFRCYMCKDAIEEDEDFTSPCDAEWMVQGKFKPDYIK